MRYRVHGETTYEYARPAVSLHTELRVLPAERASQRLLFLPTSRPPSYPTICALAERLDPRSPRALALAITDRIAERCVFEVGQTDVSDTALDFLKHGAAPAMTSRTC